MTYRAEEETLPILLQQPFMVEAWREWCADRRERRKPITARAAKLQMGRLVDVALRYGPEVAAGLLRYAVEMHYQGIFEPTPAQLERLKKYVPRSNNGTGDLRMAKKRAEDEVWKLWNELRISEERRLEILAKIERASTPDDIKVILSEIRK